MNVPARFSLSRALIKNFHGIVASSQRFDISFFQLHVQLLRVSYRVLSAFVFIDNRFLRQSSVLSFLEPFESNSLLNGRAFCRGIFSKQWRVIVSMQKGSGSIEIQRFLRIGAMIMRINREVYVIRVVLSGEDEDLINFDDSDVRTK